MGVSASRARITTLETTPRVKDQIHKVMPYTDCLTCSSQASLRPTPLISSKDRLKAATLHRPKVKRRLREDM